MSLVDADDPAQWNDRAPAGDVDALEQAIELLRRSIVATPADHPDRATILSNLGAALRIRFDHTGSLADLDEAIQIGRAATASAAIDHPDYAGHLSNLGLALQDRYERSGELADLDEAVRVGREAVSATPADHPDRAGRLSYLGLALRASFERTDSLADLDEAVSMGRRAVTAGADHPGRAALLTNLGGALQTRFERKGDRADLDEAVRVGQEAVSTNPTDDPDHAGHLSYLCLVQLARFERVGDLADLDSAVSAGQAAVAATPADHPDRAPYLSNVGLALEARFRRTGEIADMDEAVRVGWAAVAATPTDHYDRSLYLSNLGGALLARYERTGSLADLEDAVRMGQAAVAATPADHPDHSLYLSNLSVALDTRFERIGQLADLDEAIRVGQAAIATTPVDHPDRARRLSNLSGALRLRYEQTGRPDDIDEAVRVGRGAVTATPADHPDQAVNLSNLCGALLARYQHGGQLADLDDAVRLGRQAAAAVSADHPNLATILSNLGGALQVRHERVGARSDGRAAARVLRQGARLATAPPLVRAQCGRRWAAMAARQRGSRRVRQGLNEVLALLPQLVDHGLSPADRRHHLEQLQGLGPDAARAHLARPWWAGWWRRGRRADAAWVALEAGRGVLLSQALEARSDLSELRRAAPDLAAQVTQLRVQLNRYPGVIEGRVTPGDPTRVVEQRRQLADQWRVLLEQVRSRPGSERFGLPPTISQLRAAAEGGTVIAVNVATHGCDVLLLSSRSGSRLPLPTLTEHVVVEQANRFLAALYPGHGGQADATEMFEVLAWLWDAVAAPVLKHLGLTNGPGAGQAWPRIWWVATGALSVLPLHAAGYHDDPPGRTRRVVLDRVVSSYTPTVRALYQARQRSGGAERALIVGINETSSAQAAPLSLAEQEAREVHRLLRASEPALTGSGATHDEVVRGLPAAGWAHFACHAQADQDDPAASHLDLYDRPLTVQELGEMHLPSAYLAYLSACTTATGSLRLLDEAIHVASAFQLAGFAHTIATLWPVPDRVALRFASHTYHDLRAGIEPALAVHHGVHALRSRYPRHPYAWASHIHFGP